MRLQNVSHDLRVVGVPLLVLKARCYTFHRFHPVFSQKVILHVKLIDININIFVFKRSLSWFGRRCF